MISPSTITTPDTRQLLIKQTQIAPVDDSVDHRDNPSGVPTSLILRSTHDNRHILSVDVEPMMVLGRKQSMRDHEVNLDLTDFDAIEAGVSRYHAMFLAFDNRLRLKDIGSLNGTLLNGKRMITSQEYIVTHGDIITLGDLSLEVEFVD